VLKEANSLGNIFFLIEFLKDLKNVPLEFVFEFFKVFSSKNDKNNTFP